MANKKRKVVGLKCIVKDAENIQTILKQKLGSNSKIL